MKFMKVKKGFTLIELIVVTAIIAILVVGILTSLGTAPLKRSRDGRRKSDLANIQRGLELYYQDVGNYPAALGGTLCNPSVGTVCYLQQVPTDPAGYTYFYRRVTTNSYQLYSCIEETSPAGPGVTVTGYAGTTCNCPTVDGTNLCRFGVSSPNTTPLD